MKKIMQSAGMAAVCLTVLLPGMVADAGNSTVDCAGNGQEISVSAQYEPGRESPSVYCVDVVWGEMQFTYRKTEAIRWDTSAHKYMFATDEGWDADGEQLSFVNHSDSPVEISLSVQMEESYAGIRAEFDRPQIRLPSAEGTAPEEAPSGEAKLALKGSMGTDQELFEKIGTVTLQITQEEEEEPDRIVRHEDSREILGRYEHVEETVARSKLRGGKAVTLTDGTKISAVSSAAEDKDYTAVIFKVTEEEPLAWLEDVTDCRRNRMYPLWIGFYSGVREINPAGEVAITMDVPEGYEGTQLYCVGEDGSIQNIPYTVSGMTIQFDAGKTGNYVFIPTGGTTLSDGKGDAPAEISETEAGEPAKTGDDTETASALAGICLAICLYIAGIVYRDRKKTS